MTHLTPGYYRYPAIHGQKIAFVCEDDLWITTLDDLIARRMTSSPGEISYPYFSPDGTKLAYISNEEGSSEVYLINILGGLAEKITELGAATTITGWHDKGIIISTDWHKPFSALSELYFLDPVTGDLTPFSYGPARNCAINEYGTVLGRNTADPARWKRYRGGTAGELWIKKSFDPTFSPLIKLAGNLASPFWIDKRLYFISDHEKCGNIYSVYFDGTDLVKHTDFTDFFVRQAMSDGENAIFQAGGELYLFETKSSVVKKIEISYRSSFNQLKRKFVDPWEYLEEYDLVNDGSKMVYTIRGRIFTMGNWEGAAVQHGQRDGVRYRNPRWLKEGDGILVSSDQGGEYHLEIFDLYQELAVKTYQYDTGTISELKISPSGDWAVFNNHRHEVTILDLLKGEFKIIEQNRFGLPDDFDWSFDSNFIAWASPVSLANTVIKIYDLAKDLTKIVTEPVLKDCAPAFDPEGRYLYFLSSRIFNPICDNIHLDINFPRGMKPYLILLQKDLTSPFLPPPRGFKEAEEELEESKKEKKGKKEESEKPLLKIDFSGIVDRIVPFPVEEGLFSQIKATRDRVFWLEMGVKGVFDQAEDEDDYGTLKYFDLKDLYEEVFAEDVSFFQISDDLSSILYESSEGIRVLDINYEPPLIEKELPATPRLEGWIDLDRIKPAVLPKEEWRQMFSEAWRLQRDYYWSPNMSGLDWLAIYHRYLPLLERVASRTEFSDLIWELQGELATSHAYEFGGDYRETEQYKVGFLGAEIVYDHSVNLYKFQKIYRGDAWLEQSPLRAAGLNINEGDYLISIGTQKLSRTKPLHKLLAGMGGLKIQIEVADKKVKHLRHLTVQCLRTEVPLRYRDWVETNRSLVHSLSKGRIGYLHIPDMDYQGYAEFHRYFLNEYDYDGLVIDVRYNSGGHLSQLILEKLSRKRIGCDFSRWTTNQPYPSQSAKGPMVTITNEHAGSDGDIFCHAFKLLGLGKLYGKRTWGGVVGTWPRNWLVDGTVTTQPEFSFWFKDIGLLVENRGAEPDIEIEITPDDWQQSRDTQLIESVKLLLEQLQSQTEQSKGKKSNNMPKLVR